jgi:hypothetical protein
MIIMQLDLGPDTISVLWGPVKSYRKKMGFVRAVIDLILIDRGRAVDIVDNDIQIPVIIQIDIDGAI